MKKWSGDSKDITPSGDGGVRKIIIKESDDKNGFLPLHGDLVKVHYSGYLENGDCFAKSFDSQEARTFFLGEDEVLKGWQIAVATMKVHESAIFQLSPEYAYGDLGMPPTIPPGATVYFELELISIEGKFVTKDGRISRSILIHGGFGVKSPADDDLCTVNYSTQLYSDPTVVIESVDNLTFVLGEGFEVGVPFGVERALKVMKKGEKSRLKVRCGTGLKGYEKLGIPALTDLIHYVELVDYQETRKHWEMSREELMKNALEEREVALQCFEAEKYQLASRRFGKCLLYADSVIFTSSELERMDATPTSDNPPDSELLPCRDRLEEVPPSDEKESPDPERAKELQTMLETKQKLVLTSLLNLSLCDQKIGRNLKALDHATRALAIEPNNVKALYRKAMIFYRLKSLDDASKYFQKVVLLKPDMTSAKKYLDICISRMTDQNHKSKVVFKGMFDKFAKEDAEKEDEFGQKKDIFTDVGEWDNKMADGMMTLEQEMAAFGETMPEKGYDKENDNPGSDED